MNEDKNTVGDSASLTVRSTRPIPERTQANREFAGVWRRQDSQSAYQMDDGIMSRGKAKAKERSPEDIAAQAVDNGYDMIDEFLQQPDPFGIPETGQNNLSGSGVEQLLAGLAGSGGIPSNIAGMYSQYLEMWNGIFAKFLESAGEASLSGFEDITGMSPAGDRKGTDFVVLANRELEIDIHWKAGVPQELISIANLQQLAGPGAGHPEEKVAKGFVVKVRRSVDRKHQVFDIKVPNSVKAGRFTAILVNPDGVDEGYLTIQIPAG